MQELVSTYVGLLRRFMLCVGVCVLLCVCVRYRDPVQQSLQVLQQLREAQCRLQEALQHAGESVDFNGSAGDQKRHKAVCLSDNRQSETTEDGGQHTAGGEGETLVTVVTA